ncbi:MAG: type II secretion system protein [Pseudomonadota bacterium]
MKRRNLRTDQRGLTLIEVLVVLGIIAAVAGIGIQVLNGVNDDTEESLVRVEMREVTSAIQRFRRDTGYWPKQGPFDGADTNDPDLAEPANLAQLFLQPQTSLNADILTFDVPSGTGWNGPYLAELDALNVRVGDDMDASGTGDPTAGTEVVVRGIGDPFQAAPVGTVFEWINGAGVQTAQLGRPYFYFIDGSNVTGCAAPCLVSAGPDGQYNAGGGDDIVVNIGALN